MQDLTTILAIAVLIFAAYGDIRRRLIPNELSIALAVLGLVRMIVTGDWIAAPWTVAAAAAILVIGFLCFSRGWIGGGDAKLLAAVALLVGYRQLPDLLLIMSLIGGVIALVVIAIEKLRPLMLPLPIAMQFVGASLRIALWTEESLERLLRLIRPSASRAAEAPSPRSVPYGVAIAAAGVAVLVFQSSL
jgi:Flp pilus assembly protein protease CpaA